MIKTYISINSTHLIVPIKMEDVTCVIEFNGGRLWPVRTNGTFVTDNQLLQKAIEEDSEYGKNFVLRYPPIVSDKCDVVIKEDSKLIRVENVTSKQMAVEWMNSKLRLNVSRRIAVEQIKKQAERNGYYFPNL